MDLRPISTDSDYRATLAEVSRLVDLDPAPGTAEGDRLDALTTLLEAYEREHHRIDTRG